jgi:hypothetical protein
MAEENKNILEEYKEHTNQKIDEVKRHFDVVREDIDSKVNLISKQFDSIQRKWTFFFFPIYLPNLLVFSAPLK